jgi:hypothetical protein
MFSELPSGFGNKAAMTIPRAYSSSEMNFHPEYRDSFRNAVNQKERRPREEIETIHMS